MIAPAADPSLVRVVLERVDHRARFGALRGRQDSSHYILKGGVNLRFFFGSPRYSEDMDLDVVSGSVDTKAKQTDTTQRFRVRLVTEAGVALPTKVEFSRRPSNPSHKTAISTIPSERVRPYGRLGLPCPHYDGTSAALQKASALRGREKRRWKTSRIAVSESAAVRIVILLHFQNLQRPSQGGYGPR